MFYIMKKLTTEEFIERAKAVHGDKYDYSKVKYIDAKTKIHIICPKHGEFWQSPPKHLLGQGCKECGKDKISKAVSLTTEEFIERAKTVHGEKYDYSKTDLEQRDEKGRICIICPIHGEFWQEPRVHLQNSGCKLCAKTKKIKMQTKSTEKFINESRKIHGDKYDYSKVQYISTFTKVCIICPKHGEFWQTPDNHIHGHGCRKCLFDKLKESKQQTTEEFIERAKAVHGNKYDYGKVKYKNCDTKVQIICPIHGEFEQTPYNHLHSSGCPHCKGWKLEEEITKFLEKNNISFVRQKKFKWLGKQSLDVYIPSANVAIECQGLQHFKPINYFGGIKAFKYRKKLDERKNVLCKENGVRLLYFSDKQMDENIITDKEEILNEIKRSTIK